MATSSPLRRLSDWGMRLVLPMAVFGAVLSVFFGELASIDHELHLIVPQQVRPDSPVAVQALLFEDLSDASRPELVPADVELWVVRGDVEVARVALTPSPAGGAYGAIPALPSGQYRVRALATVDGEDAASLDTHLLVAPDAAPSPWEPRRARAVQHLALEPVQTVAEHTPPSPFDIRVRGGLCAPETPCALLVHPGSPPAAIRLVASAAITPMEPDPRPETAGLVELGFVAHGPDVSAVVEALRDGEVVARRGVQIPIALATPGLERLSDDPPTVRAHVLGTRPVLADAFLDGHWVRSWAFADAENPLALPGLEPGWVRIQVRQSPFSSDHAASTFVAVGGVDPLEALAQEGAGEAPPPGETELRRDWAAAALSSGVRRMPPAVSGRAEDEARIASRQALLRGVALGAIVLGLLVLSLVFVRRGVDAALEAQQIMAQTGDPELASRRHRRRTMLSALAIVATALAAFLGAAAVVIARARLLE